MRTKTSLRWTQTEIQEAVRLLGLPKGFQQLAFIHAATTIPLEKESPVPTFHDWQNLHEFLITNVANPLIHQHLDEYVYTVIQDFYPDQPEVFIETVAKKVAASIVSHKLLVVEETGENLVASLLHHLEV